MYWRNILNSQDSFVLFWLLACVLCFQSRFFKEEGLGMDQRDWLAKFDWEVKSCLAGSVPSSFRQVDLCTSTDMFNLQTKKKELPKLRDKHWVSDSGRNVSYKSIKYIKPDIDRFPFPRLGSASLLTPFSGAVERVVVVVGVTSD